jgi:two-component system cell cycle sensor histidine kinase PleC
MCRAVMRDVGADLGGKGSGVKADSDAAARRRKMTIQLREARRSLSEPDAIPSHSSAMVRLFAEINRSATPMLGIIALGVCATALAWVEAGPLATWIAFITCAILTGYSLPIAFLDSSDQEKTAGVWRRKFVFSTAFSGSAWAYLIVMLLKSSDPNAQAFAIVVMLLVSTVMSLLAAAIPAAFVAGMLPMIVGVTLLYAPHLHGARRRAEGANLAKSRFLATMSHELRTPLNAVLGFSEVMKGELFGPHAVPAYKEYSTDIHASGQHLLMLINEILDLSRVEAGRYELKEEPVSLTAVVEECLRLLWLRIERRHLVITEAMEPGLPRIWADERAVRQVALNLLSNAIKFTPQGGAITIKVGWTRKGGQYLSIADTGPGIPPEEIPIVLSSFGRGTLAQKNAEEGTGLGLPIVKGLVELHGGEFRLNSTLRLGTEVIVIFPPERVMDTLPALNAESIPEAPERRRRRMRRRQREHAA